MGRHSDRHSHRQSPLWQKVKDFAKDLRGVKRSSLTEEYMEGLRGEAMGLLSSVLGETR